RDRRGGLRAEAAVLDQHRHRDRRLVGRCVGHVPRVVAQPLVDLVRLVFLALERVDLRGAGLAARRVVRAAERGRARAFLVDLDERVADHRHVLGLEVEPIRGLALDHAHLAGLRVLDALDEVRPERDAFVGDRRDRVRELHRRERRVSLPNARRDRVAEVPLAVLLAVLRAGEALPLPFARRHDPRELALDVDAGLAAEAQRRHEPVGVVDVRVVGEQVEVGVARHDDRLGHVDHAVPALLVVAEAVRGAGELEVAGAAHRFRDDKKGGHGMVDMTKAIVVSCDTYFYLLANDTDVDDTYRFMSSLGFGRQTGIDIEGELTGIMPSREWKRQRFAGAQYREEHRKWYLGDSISAGIGQGYT